MKVNTSSMSLSTPAAHNQDETILAATGDMMYRTDDVDSGVSTAGKYMHGFKINAAGTPISGAMEFGTLEGATEDDSEFSKVNVTLPTITNAAMRVEDATTDAGIASVSVSGSTITIKSRVGSGATLALEGIASINKGTVAEPDVKDIRTCPKKILWGCLTHVRTTAHVASYTIDQALNVEGRFRCIEL